MKPSLFKTGLCLAVLLLGLLLCQRLPAAVGFTVSPSTISNNYVGTISLVVTGLTGGETVVVQKFLDANTNNTIDAADILVQQFRLTDGQASFIGGVTNINVPGDTDSTAGQITARLLFQTDDFIQKISGKYAFKLSSPVGNFTPFTNSFSVTDFPYSQTITGSVVNSGTNVPNASIILFPPPRPGHGPGTPLGGTVANNSGNYSMKVAAGAYSLMAFKSNYLVNAATAPVFTVGSGATVITNLVITNAATQSISGKIADAANNSIGLPGLGLHGSANGLLAFAFSDTNGNFTMPVRPGQWELGSEGLSTLGYLHTDDSAAVVDTTSGSTNGVIVPYSKATACLYGSLKDDQNHPLAGVHIFSSDNNYQYFNDVYTDPNGNYVAYALGGGNWQVAVEDKDNASFANYVFSQGLNQNGGTNISVGQAVPYNFTAILATNHITGHVQFNGAPVSGVQVFAYANIGGVDYQTQVNSDASGNYSLNVANGSWSVGVSCNGGDESLEGILGSGNYQCPGNQNVIISNANGTADFTVLPCGTVQITTTSLPMGTVGDFYLITLAASSCQSTFNWSLTPGSLGLPSGLGLSSGGTISGFPDTAGSNYFSVRVTDGGNHTNDKAFSLIISNAPATTPDVLLYYVAKLQAFRQTNAASVVLDTSSSPFHAYMGIVQSAPGLVSIANVTLPTSAVKGFPSGAGVIEMQIHENFASQTTLDAAYPVGSYSFAISTANDGNRFPVINMPSPVYPNAPRVSNHAAAQSINPTAGFQLQWDAFSGGTSNDSIWVLITDTNGLPVYTTPYPAIDFPGALKGTATSTTIAPGTLQLGRTYIGMISFAKTTGLELSAYPGAVGATFGGAQTTFSLSTVSTTPTLSQPAKPSATQFRFLLTGIAGQNYTIQRSTNLSSTNWSVLFITNAPATSFMVVDPTATNGRAFYRALFGP